MATYPNLAVACVAIEGDKLFFQELSIPSLVVLLHGGLHIRIIPVLRLMSQNECQEIHGVFT